MIVRADAELQARATNRLHVGIDEVLLAEMNPAAALVDRDLPVVVDDEIGTVTRADRLGLAHLAAQFGIRLILDAKLHELRAGRHQPCDPARIGNDGIERIDHGQPSHV